MPHTRYLLILILAVAATATFVAPIRVKAIVYGFNDSNNDYANTGAFIVKSPTTGHISQLCSGTLISSTVFLTASHCTVYFENNLAPIGYTAFVSFDNPIPFGDLTDPKTKLIPVTQVVSNPGYNQSQSDSGDIAVLLVQGGGNKVLMATNAPLAR